MQYEVDFTGVETRAQLHEALKTGLKLPEYYGRNMDALWDCLTELETPCRIQAKGMDGLPDGMRSAAKAIFEEAAAWHAARGREMLLFMEETA